MLLFEHDAKILLSKYGVKSPEGVLIGDFQENNLPEFKFPGFLKAQILTGGRALAGGIVQVTSELDLLDALNRLQGVEIKGQLVRELRLEKIATGRECYISLSLNPRESQVDLLISETGGVDIEQENPRTSLIHKSCPRRFDEICAAIMDATSEFSESNQIAFREFAPSLAKAFIDLEALLIEINPVFVTGDTIAIAADAKIIVDENAFARRPELRDLILERSDVYAESIVKFEQEFDYVELNGDGDVGLITTGAGLSMQIIDELTEAGLSPINFCDIRSGTFRGSAERLILVMQKISKAPNLKCVLVNFFAGVTHLGELSRLLLEALDNVPELNSPVIVRLIGNGIDEARNILSANEYQITLETDLDIALGKLIECTNQSN
ncbi:MAG: ATP-grasp domain-containing protein [Methyloligellaceae bacterium]